MKLSQNITLDMLTRSQTASRKGIDEQFNPPQEIIEKLKGLSENVIERLLLIFPDLFISSGYRSEALNAAIGGANSSQHTKGEAVDLQITKSSNICIAQVLIRAGIEFDQMIVEFGTMEKPSWIHVSWKKQGNRGQILRAESVKGKTVYSTLTKEQIINIKSI